MTPGADDIAKEVEIFASRNGVPIVVATEGDDRFTALLGHLVPPFHPDLHRTRDGRPPVRLPRSVGDR
jgi:hypothetical protein